MLSIAQLNATASVPGVFRYKPALGTLLDAGRHVLTVSFEPNDAANYQAASATVTLVVAPRAGEMTGAGNVNVGETRHAFASM
jgi:hypothetical protein